MGLSEAHDAELEVFLIRYTYFDDVIRMCQCGRKSLVYGRPSVVDLLTYRLQRVVLFYRATLCVSVVLLSSGVRPSVCLSVCHVGVLYPHG